MHNPHHMLHLQMPPLQMPALQMPIDHHHHHHHHHGGHGAHGGHGGHEGMDIPAAHDDGATISGDEDDDEAFEEVEEAQPVESATKFTGVRQNKGGRFSARIKIGGSNRCALVGECAVSVTVSVTLSLLCVDRCVLQSLLHCSVAS